MPDELKQLADDLRSTWEADLKPRIEQMEQEQKKYGDATAETKAATDGVNDRIDQLEAQFQKASLATQAKKGEQSEELKDFIHFTRRGGVPEKSELLSSKSEGGPGGQKVLAVRDETLGGVLAPPDFINEVIQGIIQWSPIRQIANVRQTSRTSVQVPIRTGNFAAQWTAETAVRTETTGRTYGLEEIPTHEMYARVLISNWDLEDPVVDLASIIQDDMSDQFGRAEGAGFVSGSGVGQPEGILTSTDLAASAVNNGGSSTFVNADGIIRLAFSVKEQYWPNARFVLSRFSLRDIRLLKDSTGNYLWQPAADGTHGVSTGLPATLYGYPYTIAVDMPSAAANAFTVAFGDFSKGYMIVDRIEIQYLRDPFTQANTGAVVFHARKRVGGQVVLPEALNLLQMV